MGPRGLEARVGAFVLGAIALVVGFILVLGDVSLSPRVPLFVDFAYTGGLQVGAPVKVSGIQVGRVDSLELLAAKDGSSAEAGMELGRQRPAVVRAKLSIDDELFPRLTHACQFSVGMQGVIGEAYIELTLHRGEALQPKAVVRGVDAPRLDRMALQLAAVLDGLGSLVTGSAENALEGELSAVSSAATGILATLHRLMTANEEELSQALADLAVTMGAVREIAVTMRATLVEQGQLARLVSDAGGLAREMSTQAPILLTQMRTSLAVLHGLLQRADAAVDTEALARVMKEVDRAAADLAAMSRQARAMVKAVERGEGTVGGLVRDPQLYDDMKELLRDLKRNPWKVLWRD